METGKSKETARPATKDRLKRLPPELMAECRQISKDIREEREDIREAKIIAAGLPAALAKRLG